MKKRLITFLTFLYLFNIIGFGGIILLDIPFHEVFSNPSSVALFVLGSLGPGIVGIFLSREEIKIHFNNLIFNAYLQGKIKLLKLCSKSRFVKVCEEAFLSSNLSYAFGWLTIRY